MMPTILLIEDASSDILLARRAVRKSMLQAELKVISDGLDALNTLFPTDTRTEPEPLPALILLDLHLPRVSGLHLLARIRENERTRGLPVAVLTSSELESDRTQSRELGADLYVSKPISPESMRELVERLNMQILLPPSSGTSEPDDG